ncbi:hypothetical protein A3J41_00500 [candidate division TM6 bacterium RIFCSPHIGHO2_12_FULL_38_8]|nr:MAG: hypothetical protein A3J41_00500 [candidate division TM6 bacterium RIFCSPHIGHO2_12_FULL_38_8]
MKLYSKLHKSILTYYQMLKEQYSIKYLKETLIGTLLAICLIGGYFLNKFYVQSREQQAFVALSEVVDSFMHSQRTAQSMEQKDKEKIEQAWQDTQILLDALYKDNSSSYLAPYFLVFKAQVILERDHNVDAAIQVLDDALKSISSTTEIGSLFHLKRIKMGFDSKNLETREKAFKDLLAMTQDCAAYGYQEALYTLGLYLISKGDAAGSQAAFKQLVDNADAKALIKSPWVILAQEKLGLSTAGASK